MNYDAVHEYDIFEKIPLDFPEYLMTKKNVVAAIEDAKDLLPIDVEDERLLYAIALLEINTYSHKDVHIWDEPVDVISNHACDCVMAEIGWGLMQRKLNEEEPVLIK